MQSPRTATLLLLLAVLLAAAPRVRAQDSLPTLAGPPEVSFVFGETILFQAEIDPVESVQTISVFFQAVGGNDTIVEEMAFDPSTGVAVYNHQIAERFVKAFSTIDFWFRIETKTGAVETSPVFTFFYEDNRFVWQMMEDGPFHLHWYEGDAAFAQSVLDAAQEGMAETRKMIPAPALERVDIYAYADTEAYLFAQGLVGPKWAGGHADPASGLILLSLRPGAEQQLQINRKIPHEVAHLMLFQAAGEGSYNLPIWLNEGIASTMELQPNPDFQFLIENAAAKDQLRPIPSMCEAFPQDASGALLSYAESTAFIRYIRETYGDAGLRAIVENYADGASCETGTNVPPIGLPLSALEEEWVTARFSDIEPAPANPLPVEVNTGTLLPWLVLGAAVLTGPLIIAVGSRRRGKRQEETG